MKRKILSITIFVGVLSVLAILAIAAQPVAAQKENPPERLTDWTEGDPLPAIQTAPAAPAGGAPLAPIYYTDRPTFEGMLGSMIIDDYGAPPYPPGFGIYDNVTFSAFLGETDYETTGHNNLNIHQSDDTYCAGCNGSFRLSFQTTSFTFGGVGVYGVGVDIPVNSPSLPYYAYITYGDGTTDEILLPVGASFFGVTAPELIVSIHFGLSGGGSTQGGSFVIDNLTIGDQPLGYLEGLVYDADTMAPIEGADVEAADGLTFHTFSGGDGIYTMTVPADTYTVTGSAFGYLPTTIPSVTVVVSATTVQDIALTVAPTYVVDGYVTDSATGWPLYASIDTNSPAGVAWTDPETGYYSIILPDGMPFDFHVEAWVPGYIPEDRVVGPISGDTTENFPLDADLTECSAPGYQKTYDFFDDFESGYGNWTATGLWNEESELNTCGSLVAPFPSSSHAVYYGIDGTCTFDTGAANSGELTLVSPVTLPGFGGSLQFASYEETECGGDCYYDNRYVEISNDGGATWNPLGEGDTEGTWYSKGFDLSAYGGEDVLIRFRFDTIDGIGNDYFGWMVDDVGVVTGCVPQAGGLVVGNVYNENTLDPLVGAKVENDSGEETFAMPTPDDPNVDDAFYTLFSPPGDHLFTASFVPPYGSDDETVAVIDGATVGQDFFLPAPHLVLDPEELEAWLITGTLVYTHVTGLDLINDGGMPLDFELVEISHTVAFASVAIRPAAAPAGASDSTDVAAFPVAPTLASQTAGTGALLIQDYDAWGFPAITTILTDNGIPYDVIGSAQIPTYDFSPYKMIIIPSIQSSAYNTIFNDNLAKFEDYIDDGGLMLMSFCEWYEPLRLPPFGGTNIWDGQSDNYIVEPGYPIFAGVTNPYTGTSASHNSLTGLLPDDRVLVTAGDVPGGNVVMIERDHGAGMLVAGGQTFEFGWGNGQDAGIILENMIPYYYFNTNLDVPWFWEDPITGTVPATSTYNVDILFTAVVTDPLPLGTYTATLVVNSNDPVADAPEVPVTMHIVEAFIDPAPSFESNAPLCLGETTVFTNTSMEGLPPTEYYTWDFGDGTTMTTMSTDTVTHTYAAADTYTVTLTAHQVQTGVEVVYTESVEVKPLPVADFTYTVDALTVDFTSTSLNATTHTWDFGDGFGDVGENVSHTYAAPGDYLVSLTVYGDCGVDQIEMTVTATYYYIYLPIVIRE